MKLSEAQKKAVPLSQRGIPGKSGTGSFPMPDKKHAKAAILLSGKAPASKRTAIKAKAEKVLGNTSSVKKSAANIKSNLSNRSSRKTSVGF